MSLPFFYRVLIVLAAVLASSLADAGDERERRAVVAIFDLLTSKMEVTSGDTGGVYPTDCVFSRQWDKRWLSNKKGEYEKPFRPRELLSLQEALDPNGQHSEMFCDRDERDRAAQTRAQTHGKVIDVASFEFSYPIFNRDFTTATVFYERASWLFMPNGKRAPPAASYGVVTLRRNNGVWTYKSRVTGMS